MINNNRPYLPTDKMSDLICQNCALLMVMSRFGLSLGFGDKSVAETCRAQGVDCDTFLAVANFDREETQSSSQKIALQPLMEYLKRAHTYFLDFALPTIRRKLIEAIDCSGANEVALLILKFYDEYSREVRRHMEHENREVFTYVEGLLQGRLSADYDIDTYSSRHDRIESRLKELKNIIIKYLPERENNNLLNAVLFDIFNCEEDLALHCRVENALFVPAVARLEAQLQGQSGGSGATQPQSARTEEELLSQREREVIIGVVKGLTNKEIADRLSLSVHTVITHRRNIARKLQIHSPAGLTIYAIVNRLVSLEEIGG